MAQNRFAVSAWPLRRKLALALAIPMLLAAVFGGLRVQTELEQAAELHGTPPARSRCCGPRSPTCPPPSRPPSMVAGQGDRRRGPERRDRLRLWTPPPPSSRTPATPPTSTAERAQAATRCSTVHPGCATRTRYVSLGQSVSQVRAARTAASPSHRQHDRHRLVHRAASSSSSASSTGRLAARAMQQLLVAARRPTDRQPSRALRRARRRVRRHRQPRAAAARHTRTSPCCASTNATRNAGLLEHRHRRTARARPRSGSTTT